MSLRRLTAAALAAGTLLVPVAPASATCYLGTIDICDKPTDPYTDPVTRTVTGAVVDVITNPAVEPTYWTVIDTTTFALMTVYCTAGLC